MDLALPEALIWQSVAAGVEPVEICDSKRKRGAAFISASGAAERRRYNRIGDQLRAGIDGRQGVTGAPCPRPLAVALAELTDPTAAMENVADLNATAAAITDNEVVGDGDRIGDGLTRQRWGREFALGCSGTDQNTTDPVNAPGPYDRHALEREHCHLVGIPR